MKPGVMQSTFRIPHICPQKLETLGMAAVLVRVELEEPKNLDYCSESKVRRNFGFGIFFHAKLVIRVGSRIFFRGGGVDF